MRAHGSLAAEQLLPGDLVVLEGMTLEIEDVIAGRDFIELEFVELGWTFIADRKTLIQTVSMVSRLEAVSTAHG
jgi:hypothetical protein